MTIKYASWMPDKLFYANIDWWTYYYPWLIAVGVLFGFGLSMCFYLLSVSFPAKRKSPGMIFLPTLLFVLSKNCDWANKIPTQHEHYMYICKIKIKCQVLYWTLIKKLYIYCQLLYNVKGTLISLDSAQWIIFWATT